MKQISRENLVDAFCILLGCDRQASPEAKRLADFGLIGLCRMALRRSGSLEFNGRFPVKQDQQFDDQSMNEFESRSAFEVIRAAMGAGFIVSDTFSEALNQTFLSFYDQANPTWQRWANACEVSRLSGTRNDYNPADTPAAVPAGQEYPPHSESNKTSNEILLEKRGRVLKISYETLLAGDMPEIQRLLKEEVAALVRAEDDEVVNALTSTSGFFTAKNTLSGRALSKDNLQLAITTLRQMKTGRTKMHYTPAVLLIPSDLEILSLEIMEAAKFDLEIIVESRLDDVSAVDWFLIADKQQSDSVVLQFLTGFRKPEVRRLPRTLDFDGERYRIKHVCKAKATRPYAVIKGDV